MNVPIIDTKPFELFLDLDGVFANFDHRIFELSGKTCGELGNKLWKYVNQDQLFFLNLELMPNALHLWEYARQYDPVFLTGAPHGDHFCQQKRDWVIKRFGPQYTTVVLPAKEKQLHAGPNKVLVDDTSKNINEWVARGGIGLLHTDVLETIKQLEELRSSYRKIS